MRHRMGSADMQMNTAPVPERLGFRKQADQHAYPMSAMFEGFGHHPVTTLNVIMGYAGEIDCYALPGVTVLRFLVIDMQSAHARQLCLAVFC